MCAISGQGEAEEVEKSGGPTSSPSDISVTVKQGKRGAEVPPAVPRTSQSPSNRVRGEWRSHQQSLGHLSHLQTG